jgi:hypothetical protein
VRAALALKKIFEQSKVFHKDIIIVPHKDPVTGIEVLNERICSRNRDTDEKDIAGRLVLAKHILETYAQIFTHQLINQTDCLPQTMEYFDLISKD